MNAKHRLAVVDRQPVDGQAARDVARTRDQLVKAAGGIKSIGLALVETQDAYSIGLGYALEALAELIEEEINTVEDWGERACGLKTGTEG